VIKLTYSKLLLTEKRMLARLPESIAQIASHNDRLRNSDLKNNVIILLYA